MSAPTPKYAQLENERRWLVAEGAGPDLASLPNCLIEDWYVDDSHLRLRRVTEDGRAATWKLCKKYGTPKGLSQPIVNVYLEEGEFHLLRRLPGREIVKRRYTVSAAPPTDFFAIDVFQGSLLGLITCEVERGSSEAVANFDAPTWLGPEITHDMRFQGGSLAGAAFADLRDAVRDLAGDDGRRQGATSGG